MCEHCRECGVISVEKYEADDDELCEFMEEQEDEESDLIDCHRKAEYLVVETTVEDHLCPDHVAKVQTEDAEGELFAESMGLDSSQILPIEEEYSGRCEYFDPLDSDPEPCANRASHARLLETETLCCEEHAEIFQEEFNRRNRNSEPA